MKRDKLKKFLFDEPTKWWEITLNIGINIFWVFLLGVYISNSYIDAITIIIVWTLALKMGKAKHYSNPLKCFMMQVLLFTSIFISTWINIYVAIMFTILAKYLMSGHADIDEEVEIEKASIKDITLWSGKTSKYDALKDFITRNPNNKYIIENEKYWEEHYYDRYTIFTMIFREHKSYKEVNILLGLEPDNNNKIKEECKIIYATFEKTLRLPPL